MQDLRCPKGCATLQRETTPHGLLWQCPTCKGRSISVSVLRKSVEPKIVTALWTLAREGLNRRGPGCVHCLKSMEQVSIALGEPSPESQEPAPELELDVCLSCHFVWFDPGELAAMPQQAPKPEEASSDLPPEAVELWARLRAGQVARSTNTSFDAIEMETTGRYKYHLAGETAASGLLSVLGWGLFD